MAHKRILSFYISFIPSLFLQESYSQIAEKEYMPQGDQPLSALQPGNLTRGQLFAQTFAFTLKHCLTQGAVRDLVDLLNAVLPGCLPPNLYYCNKITDVGDTLQTHVCCPTFSEYIGKHDFVTKQCECHGCGNVVDVYDAVKAGSLLTYSLENALRELFELHRAGKYLAGQCDKASDTCTMSDICDGALYSGREDSLSCMSLLLTCNVDGAPVF